MGLAVFMLGLSGCKTLPDVKPFADFTVALAVAAGTQYHDIATDVGTLQVIQLPRETGAAFQDRERTLDDAQKVFAQTGKSLDQLFDAMTAYSEKLSSLAATGKTGSQAAQSLLDSAKGFSELAGITIPGGSDAAKLITRAFKAIADEFTQIQARKSLQEAVAAAQPAVDMVAKQFADIYAAALLPAIESIRNTRKDDALNAAGRHIIGFNDNVKIEYNSYYQTLNGLVAPPPEDHPELAWHGFCKEPRGSCRAKDELEAVGLVEARMAAIHPIVVDYEARIAAIEETRSHRQQSTQAVVRAVRAWALEHKKLQQSLQDGTSMSAFNLRSALLELDGLLAKKQ